MLRIENDRTRTILPIMLLAILWVAAAFSQAVLFATLAGTPLVAVLILEMYKSIRMDSRGCYVQVLFWHKFYPWSSYRTILRMTDDRITQPEKTLAFFKFIVYFCIQQRENKSFFRRRTE